MGAAGRFWLVAPGCSGVPAGAQSSGRGGRRSLGVEVRGYRCLGVEVVEHADRFSPVHVSPRRPGRSVVALVVGFGGRQIYGSVIATVIRSGSDGCHGCWLCRSGCGCRPRWLAMVVVSIKRYTWVLAFAFFSVLQI